MGDLMEIVGKIINNDKHYDFVIPKNHNKLKIKNKKTLSQDII
jgi:hypothetical protein